MSVLTLYNGGSLGVHVVDMGAEEGEEEEEEEQALRSSWDGGYRGDEEYVEELVKEEDVVKVSRRQMALIYSLQLAEAIVAASLQPQLYVLLRDTELCGSVNAAYWTGLVEAIFAIGSIAGLFWGRIGDRQGRRPIALIGMLGLSMSCVAMGFSDGIIVCALIRAFAGLMSSSIRVAMATMIGDVSTSANAKSSNFARLPLISVGGVIGPLLQAALAHRFAENNTFWQRFPIFTSQLACASLMLVILVLNLLFLEETLPRSSGGVDEEKLESTISLRRGSESSYDEYGEQDSFLRRGEKSAPPDNLKPIGFSDIIRTPSLMIILASYSFLSLHSASFDQLLPLLGNSPTEHGGLGLPCSFVSLVALFASFSAGLVIYHFFGRSVRRLGLLQLYRLCCWAFPVIYVATPLLSKVAQGYYSGIIIASVTSIFVKTLVTGFAKTLVAILVTNASPDPYSLATIMGFMQCASVFRSLAVAGTGVAVFLSDEVSIQTTNYGLWSTMAAVSLAGAAIAYFVCDHPTVRDYQSSLKWEVCYDSMEDLGYVDEKLAVKLGVGIEN